MVGAQWVMTTYLTGWSVTERMAALSKFGACGFCMPSGSAVMTPSGVTMNIVM